MIYRYLVSRNEINWNLLSKFQDIEKEIKSSNCFVSKSISYQNHSFTNQNEL